MTSLATVGGIRIYSDELITQILEKSSSRDDLSDNHNPSSAARFSARINEWSAASFAGKSYGSLEVLCAMK